MTKNRIRCPYCERLFDIEQMETADLFSERVDLAARLGRAWHLVNEYADCFAQSSGGRIGLKKRVRLIREVIRLWDGCTFELDGKRFKTTHENIMQAMTTVCNADKFGFKNHNYLKRVLCDTAVRISAEGLSAKEEEDREVRRRQARLFSKENEAGSAGEALSAEEFKRRRGVASLTDRIGRPDGLLTSPPLQGKRGKGEK